MKSCLGWFGACIGWFIIWGLCCYFADSWKTSPFLLLFTGIAILLVFALLFIGTYTFIHEKKRQKKEKIFQQITENIQHPYPRAFSEFLIENNIKYQKNNEYNDDIISKILSIDKTYWKERNDILETEHKNKRKLKSDFINITKLYPNGYQYWSKNNHGATIDFTVAHRQEIEQYEANYIAEKKCEEWVKQQISFSNECIDYAKDLELGFGRYCYDIDFNKTDIAGNNISGKFAIWNFFQKEFCTIPDLDYSTRPHIIKNTEIVKSLENCPYKLIEKSYPLKFYNFLYSFLIFDDSFGFNIIINNKNHTSETDKFNYLAALDSIFSGFKEDETLSSKFSILFASDLSDVMPNSINDNNIIFNNTIILDFATSISDIKTLSSKIANLSPKFMTTILYLSFFKEYSKTEMMDIIKKDAILIEEKRLEESARQKAIPILCSAPSKWEKLKNGLPFNYLFHYYPVNESITNDEIWRNRNIIWNFKNDAEKTDPESNLEAINFVINGLKDKLYKTFQLHNIRFLTLVCVPASTKISTERRYKHFSELLCKELGCINSYSHISVIKDKETRRSGGTGLDLSKIQFDKLFFKDKYIILFDDIITRGDSMCIMTDKLRSLGAHVVCAFSIGKTKHIDSMK